MTLSIRSVAFVFFVALEKSAGQWQSPLGLDHHIPSEDVANLTKSFTSNHWPQSGPYAWNGLTTFANTMPLRCFGIDEGQKFDVAILGMFPHTGTRYSLISNSLIGAPFDTATSYRPGYFSKFICVFI